MIASIEEIEKAIALLRACGYKIKAPRRNPEHGPGWINLEGSKFGKLTVTSAAHIKDGEQYWNCVCDCGEWKTVKGRHLRTGNTLSCGCLRKVTGGGWGSYQRKLSREKRS